MNVFEKFVKLISFEFAKKHYPYGWFHILWLITVICATVFLCVKLKDCDEKTFRKTLLITWIVIFVFEIYKQIVSPFNYNNGNPIWDYNTNDIPYQFCSSIHYVLLPIVFLKDGKVRDAFMSFSSTFVFLAGLMVMIIPDQLSDSKVVGLCMQTMLHHGAQILAGAFISVRMRKKFSVKYFLSGVIVFLAFLIVAMGLNLILSPKIIHETINFFYISPYYGCPLPVLGDIQKVVPYIVFFMIYCVGFIVASALIAFLFWFFLRKLQKNQ